MIAFARAHVLAILRQHGLSTADAGAIVDEDDRAALGAFLSGRTDDIDIVPLEDLAHVLGLTLTQLIGDARPTSIHWSARRCINACANGINRRRSGVGLPQSLLQMRPSDGSTGTLIGRRHHHPSGPCRRKGPSSGFASGTARLFIG
jgi:hypothetical protein